MREARITQSELNDQGAEGQTGVLSFDLPRASLQERNGAIGKSAVVLSQTATRSLDTQNTIDSKLRFSLTSAARRRRNSHATDGDARKRSD